MGTIAATWLAGKAGRLEAGLPAACAWAMVCRSPAMT